GEDFREKGGGFHAAAADLTFLGFGPPAHDVLARQVHHRVHLGEPIALDDVVVRGPPERAVAFRSLRTHQSIYLVARLLEGGDEPGADQTGRAGNQDAHDEPPWGRSRRPANSGHYTDTIPLCRPNPHPRPVPGPDRKST